MLPQRTFRRQIAVLVALVLGFCAVNVHAQARKPYTKDAILGLLKGEVAPQRVAVLARQRGIDFQITSQVESELRRAGATPELLATLREIAPKSPAPKPAQIVIQTAPNAQVYLDDVFKGQSSPEGRLVIDNAKPGDHALRVSLAGKRNYEQKLTVIAGQVTQITALLADLAGSVVVQASPGAEVSLDGSSRGTADARGRLAIPEVAAGSHELRVSASGKKEYRETVRVAAGQESAVEATLAEIETPKPKPPVETPRLGVSAPVAGTVKENPKDGLKYVWIPPGTFMMGCSPGDSECEGDEKPPHGVTITKGFWMGQTVVTVAAYRRFAGSTGAKMPTAPSFNKGWNDQEMPIVNVSWDDATAFCGWAGGRLPTEAEWEYAARAGSTEARYGPIGEVAWYSHNSGQKTHEVAQKRPNAWNLYDTLGNVWEWVNDWYGENYYPASPERDPRGPDRGQYRILRGGSSCNFPRNVRVSVRLGFYPSSRGSDVGFRCGGEVFVP